MAQEPFCLVATEMGRAVNAAIEAEPVVEQSCFMSIKELPVPSNVAWGRGDREVTVTK